MNGIESLMTIESLVGATFVVLDGWRRFNNPVRADSLATYRALQLDSRSSTTAISYFGALGLYLGSLLTAFALLVANHGLLKKLTNGQPLAELDGLGLPMLAALALIVVVPQLKPFSTFEVSLRGRLQSWASIPVEVSRFAHDLEEYEYVVPGSAKGAALDIGDVPGSGDSSGQQHLEAKTLLDSLEAWKSSRVFGGYFASFSGVHQQLQAEAKKLKRQVEVYQEAVLELGIESKAARTQRESLKESANELLRGVCYFIAAGILRCCPLESARNRELARLGFVPGSRRPESILPGQVALLLLMVTSIFVVSALLKKPDDIGEALIRSVRIASLYLSATLTAVYLWHRFRRPSSGLLRDRPYHQYLCAAGLATGVCLFLSLAFRSAEFMGDLSGMLAHMKPRLPYQLLTAAAAFGIAFLLDNPPPREPWARRQRLLEGASLSLLLGALAVLVHSWLAANQPGRVPPLASLVATGSAVGFLLGSCLPTWCRANRQATTADARRDEVPVAVAVPQQLAS